MATVYLAHDVRHDRHVAIKVLRPELAAVLGAERFVQEIRTTASLQHPHILPLFDSGRAQADDDRGGQEFLYYVMPYVEGETLRDKLNRETQLDMDEAIRITGEIADALDYAHRHGVVHRDIKPENILLHDGRPMVADFGIALAVSAAAGGRMTETGLSLGTPHYMSPEQATAAKDITARSDIYSLAAVLYEMLTGEPPHTGASAQQVIMKIVTEEVDSVTLHRKATPPHVAATLRKALEKLPADRFDNATRFAEALRDPRIMAESLVGVSRGPDPGGVTGSMRRWRWWGWTAILMAASGLGGWLLRPSATQETAVTRFAVQVPGGHDMFAYWPNIAVSNDGRALAYFADGVLYRLSFDRADPVPLAQVAGWGPMFSPDGEWIYFGQTEDFDLQGVPASGGPVTDFSNRPVDWDVARGMFDRGIALRRAGETTWNTVTTPVDDGTEVSHQWPQLLDGGRLVLFTALGPGMMWNGTSVVLQDLETGERTTIVTGGSYGRYVPTGHVIYIRANGTVEAVPFNLDRRRVTGTPEVVESGVRTGYWGAAASFAVSPSGTFAFVRGSSWIRHRLTWVDRSGNVLEEVGPPVTVEGVRLSPDERSAVSYVASANADIARFDLATGEMRRLTFAPTTEDNPIWSPDGRRVAYREATVGDGDRILSLSLGSDGEVEELYRSPDLWVPRSWSPDGRAIALEGDDKLMVVDLETGVGDTVTQVYNEGIQFSPDGRWLAYAATETGQMEVYVVSFPSLRNKHQVSAQGGRFPEWSAESGELFFVNGDTLLVTEVSTAGEFRWTRPHPLFVKPDLMSGFRGYSVSADGQRILYPALNPDARAREIQVVLNWFQELERIGR